MRLLRLDAPAQIDEDFASIRDDPRFPAAVDPK